MTAPLTRSVARLRRARAIPLRVALIVALLAPALLLAPGGVAAATAPPDGVTGIRAACALDESSILTDLSHEGPISFQTGSLAGQASAGTLGAATEPAPGDDCNILATFDQHVTIGSGTSGLQIGDPVTLTVTVGVEGVIAAGLAGGPGTALPAPWSASALATMDASYRIREPFCREICETYVDFDAQARTEYDDASGSDAFWSGSWSWGLSTNLDADLYDEWSAELGPELHGCIAPACPDTTINIAIAPGVVTFQAAVGDELLVSAGLGAFVAHTDAGHGVSDFFDTLASTRIEPASGFEGVSVSYDGEAAGDVDPPALTTPGPLTAEATGPDGAEVAYNVTATDAGDSAPLVACVNADTGAALSTTGALFPLGVMTVSCSASDASGNVSASRSFTVTVADTVAPTLTVPAGMTVAAAGPDGAIVTFTATASDAVDPAPVVVCAPASGATFAIGATSVNCVATDASGNASAAQAFTVTVLGPDASAQLRDLQNYVAGLAIPRGAKTIMLVTIAAARGAVALHRPDLACYSLQALITEADGMRGKQLTSAQADTIIAAALNIRATLGC